MVRCLAYRIELGCKNSTKQKKIHNLPKFSKRGMVDVNKGISVITTLLNAITSHKMSIKVSTIVEKIHFSSLTMVLILTCVGIIFFGIMMHPIVDFNQIYHYGKGEDYSYKLYSMFAQAKTSMATIFTTTINNLLITINIIFITSYHTLA